MDCKNCQNSLPAEADYCPECGAKVIRNRLTMRNLWNDVVSKYLDIDNRFLKTFAHLLSKPEVVIDGYIHGTRKKYVNPISYFALALTLAGLQVFLTQKFFPEAYDMSAVTAEGQEELMNTVMGAMQEYSAVLTMIMIPVYALMARIVFLRNKKYNYTELLVVFLYYASEVGFLTFIPFLFLHIFGLNYADISMYALLFQVILGAYYIKRLYDLSTKGIILKTLLFLLVLVVFYVISVFITSILLVVTGNMPVTPPA